MLIDGDEQSHATRWCTNLVSNAIKFTAKAGGPRHAAEPALARRVDMARFSVTDTGCEHRSRSSCPMAFERFRQEDASRRRGRKGGLGLGLGDDAASLVKLHGGTIEARTAQA